MDIEEMRLFRPKVHQPEPIITWNLPLEGWCKLNTNGSFGPGEDAWAGMIVRDHK
jgi:hypothetical protein